MYVVSDSGIYEYYQEKLEIDSVIVKSVLNHISLSKRYIINNLHIVRHKTSRSNENNLTRTLTF